MAKPLGPKSVLIREAITANPGMGNTELAKLLNDADERMDDKIKVTAQDVATQRQSMKKVGAVPVPAASAPAAKPARKKPGRKPAPRAAAPAAVPVAPAPSSNGRDVVSTLEAIKSLVDQLGVDQVKRIAEIFRK